jgi:uncharacterized protein DUF5419
MKISFEDWMKKVDELVGQRIGLSVHDLVDCPFRDWFDAGVTPQEAAHDAIRYDGGFDFDDE